MKSDKLAISIQLVIDFLLTIGYNNFDRMAALFADRSASERVRSGGFLSANSNQCLTQETYFPTNTKGSEFFERKVQCSLYAVENRQC